MKYWTMRPLKLFERPGRPLVFGTIHASSAWQTFGRIYDLFPEGEREQIRKLLSYNLQAIIYQRLLPTLKPEVARALPLRSAQHPDRSSTSSRPRKGSWVMKNNADEGCRTSTALADLVESEMVHHKVAINKSPSRRTQDASQGIG